MVFPAVVEIKFFVHFFGVEGVYFVFLEVDVAVVLVLPEGDEVADLAHLHPVAGVELLRTVQLVAHDVCYL